MSLDIGDAFFVASRPASASTQLLRTALKVLSAYGTADAAYAINRIEQELEER